MGEKSTGPAIDKAVFKRVGHTGGGERFDGLGAGWVHPFSSFD